MRHLPVRGRLFSGGRGGAGLPIGLGATSPGGGSRGTHERRAERGPWGSKLQRGLKTWGGGCGRRSGGAGFVWLNIHGIRVGRGELASGWLRWATGGGRGGIFRFRGVGSGTGGRNRACRTVSVACRVVFGTVGAACGGGDAAVKDWLEVSTLGAGWVGAAVLCFRVGTGAEGADSGVLAARFDMAESPAVIALLGGGRRVGSLDSVVATKDGDSGEIG